MRVPAKLNFVTVQRERVEFETAGFVEQTADKTVISYKADGYCLTVATDGISATVTRTGDSPYVMTLQKGATCVFKVDSLETELYTEKLRLSKTENKIRFWAEYFFANDASTTMQIIITATF